MDSPNVTTRQQQQKGKNGKGNQQQQQEQTTTPPENSAGSGEKPTAQSAFLPGFSADQAQSLTTFVSDVIANTLLPIKADLATKEDLATVSSNMASLQATINQLIKSQQSPNKATPPNGSNMLNSSQSQEPNFGGAPTQFGFNTRNPFTRWRPEELGTFDPDLDNIYTFVERIREVADIRDPHIVQLNLSLQLRGKVKRWFELELTHDDKSVLYTLANNVTAWIDALVNRFQPFETLLL